MLVSSATGHEKGHSQTYRANVESPSEADTTPLLEILREVSIMSLTPEANVAHVGPSIRVTGRFETLATGSARDPSHLLLQLLQVPPDLNQTDQ